MSNKYLFGALTFAALLIPFAAHAASSGILSPIISAACNCANAVTANGVTVPSSAPAWGCIMQTIQNLLNDFVSLAVVIISLFIAQAGFTYMTSGGSAEKRQLANKRLLNAVIGLLIVLSAWLIVDSLMKVIYKPEARVGSSTFGPWNAILASQGESDCIAPVAPPDKLPSLAVSSTAGGGDGSNQVSAVPAPGASTATGNEAAVRAQFAAAGVSVNHNPCTGSSGSGCTNVGGMQQTTIQQVINLSNKCGGCGMVVTGGNEPGHASGTYSHGNGYKVDLRLGTAMDGIIQHLKRVADRIGDGPGPTWIDSCNNQYVQESDHWDVTVHGSCPL